MVGCLALELGKFPEEIRAMPYPDAILLWHTLEEAPPVRMLFAQFAGYKHESSEFTGKKKVSPDDFMMMQRIIGPAAPTMPAHLKAAMEWAEGLKKDRPGLQPQVQ